MYAKLKRKVCLQCKEEKSLELFRHRLKRSESAYESYCKDCESVNNKEWCIRNKKILKNRDFIRNCRKFGLSVSEYEKMDKLQESKCAICKNPETQRRSGELKRLAIDHCHMSGIVRALLCNACNTAMGLLKEDPKIIKAVIKYLNKFKR